MRDNFVAPVNILDDLLGGGVSKPVAIRIVDIRRDGATQPRAGLDNQHVEDLIQALTEGATLPAIDVMFDGTFYWVYDGFHRIAAHERLGRTQISANVYQGAQTDAQWESYAVNKSHGLKRSNEDKKRQVKAALRHPKGATLSNSQIAKHVGVDEKTVRFYREQLESASEIPKVTDRKGADGKTYNTAKIGTRPAPQVTPAKPVYTPVTVAGNSEPTLGTPIPPRADNKREYTTVNELIEEVKTCVKPHYTGTGLTRFQIADDMRQNSNTRSGAFWDFACRQTANFRSLDMALAISQVAYQVSVWGVDFDPAVAHADGTVGGAPTIVTLDDLPVVDSVTVPWAGPVGDAIDQKIAMAAQHVRNGVDARKLEDETPDHPLDCYEDVDMAAVAAEDRATFERLQWPARMRDLHELKMWLKTTRDEKAREYTKLTGWPAPAGLISGIDTMLLALEHAMDATEKGAVVDAHH